MIPNPIDMQILRDPEVYRMMTAYRSRFGKGFVPFNYEDFQGTKDTPAAVLWRDALRRCLEENRPYNKESHAFEASGH